MNWYSNSCKDGFNDQAAGKIFATVQGAAGKHESKIYILLFLIIIELMSYLSLK
jgi:hypothetical protein